VSTLSAAQIAGVAKGAGFTGDGLTKAVAIALAESSGRTDVVNFLGCVGLWQIYQSVHVRAHPTWTTAWLKVPQNNAAAAYVLSSGGTNWRPWETYTNGMYLAHMGAARAAVGAPAGVENVGAWGDFGSAVGGALGPVLGLPFGSQAGGAAGGALDGAGSGAIAAAGGVLGTLDAVGGFFGVLGQRGTWVRVLEVVGGAGLMVAGIALVGHGVIGDVAAEMVPGGKLLSAAGAS